MQPKYWAINIFASIMRPQLGKEKIVQAALLLFSENGFHATSTTQIADRANVSKGLMYNYFKSKEELLFAIIDAANKDITEFPHSFPNSATAIEKPKAKHYHYSLRYFLKKYAHILKTNKQLLTLQFSLLFQPDLRENVIMPLRQRTDRLFFLTERMFQQANISNPTMTARRFTTELDGITIQYLSRGKHYPIDEILEQVYLNYEVLKK